MTDVAKRAAGVAAAGLVRGGMAVGLGSGSTMRFAVEALAARVRDEGLGFVGVPTSEAVAGLARGLGLTLVELDGSLELAIDGADEVERRHVAADQGAGRGVVAREDRGAGEPSVRGGGDPGEAGRAAGGADAGAGGGGAVRSPGNRAPARRARLGAEAAAGCGWRAVRDRWWKPCLRLRVWRDWRPGHVWSGGCVRWPACSAPGCSWGRWSRC